MNKLFIIPRHYLQIIIRVILIIITSLLFAFSITANLGWFTSFNLGILILLQGYLFIIYSNRINRMLERFFSSLKDDGSSMGFSRKYSEKSLVRLYEYFDRISQQLKQLEESNVKKSHYFHTVFQHVGVGLISFFDDGRIENINNAALRILGLKDVGNIHQLKTIHPDLPAIMSSLQPGRQRLLKIRQVPESIDLLLKATEFIRDEVKITLISLQNISPELQEKELDSWQKLIRVLTHEIMNSVAPISSSIETMTSFFSNPTTGKPVDASAITQETVNNTLRGLEIIGSRSKGLLEFVRQYRKFSFPPRPEFKNLRVADILNDIQGLMNEHLDKYAISFHYSVEPEDLMIEADKKLIEQVLINLVNNSIDSLARSGKDKRYIVIRASLNEDDRVIIAVTDNGKGIPPEIIDHIFIPFFSTKEEGTGIGLSLSRQVIRLHQGSISVESVPGNETTFTLVF